MQATIRCFRMVCYVPQTAFFYDRVRKLSKKSTCGCASTKEFTLSISSTPPTGMQGLSRTHYNNNKRSLSKPIFNSASSLHVPYSYNRKVGKMANMPFNGSQLKQRQSAQTSSDNHPHVHISRKLTKKNSEVQQQCCTNVCCLGAALTSQELHLTHTRSNSLTVQYHCWSAIEKWKKSPKPPMKLPTIHFPVCALDNFR